MLIADPYTTWIRDTFLIPALHTTVHFLKGKIQLGGNVYDMEWTMSEWESRFTDPGLPWSTVAPKTVHHALQMKLGDEPMTLSSINKALSTNHIETCVLLQILLKEEPKKV